MSNTDGLLSLPDLTSLYRMSQTCQYFGRLSLSVLWIGKAMDLAGRETDLKAYDHYGVGPPSPAFG